MRVSPRTNKAAPHATAPAAAPLEGQERSAEIVRFAYAASHDLNAPLRKIVSFGDLLKARLKDKLGAEELDYLERMQRSAAVAAKLVADLLTLCRVEHEDLPLENVDLDAAFAAVKVELAAEISAAGARIESGRLPVLSGHAPLFHSLLLNILSNAVRFRRPDQPLLVRVDSRRDGEAVEITVADNGIGFAQEYAEKIFQPFLRLNAMSEYPGNGLGLAICRGVARRYGGSLTAAGEPGRGSTFTLRLPAAMLAR